MSKPTWTGMCPASKHGLDYEGQPCDVCAHAADPSLTPATCPQARNCRVCWRLRGRKYPMP